jgi:hypothetical protein
VFEKRLEMTPTSRGSFSFIVYFQFLEWRLTRQNDFSNIVFNQLLRLVSVSKSGPESGPRTDKGSQLILHITAQKRKPNIKHHSQVDDPWACFDVPEWGVFCHAERI